MTLLDGGRLPVSVSERIIVRQAGETLFDEHIGAKDATFSLLCVSKPIFALAALHFLLGQTDVSLDAPVRRFLPTAFGPRFDSIRISDLLTHSSGITRDATPGRWTEERYQRWIAGSPVDLTRTPRYSVMTGWYVLSLVLERASGTDRTVIAEHFGFEPFGANLGYGALSPGEPPPLPIMNRQTGEREPDLWWADAPEILRCAWAGSGFRGEAEELMRIFDVIASAEGREALPGALRDAVGYLMRPVGGGLSTDGEKKHAFTFSHGAFVGWQWLGQRPGREALGFDSGTGSFVLADVRREMAVVYLSNLVREPVESLMRRRRLMMRIYAHLDQVC
ncbi:serine hydrolase domain-containing protein [Rhodococcus pyridinivorans]|uniref:Beta-lactamase family protein n=1 Tax=Rhodococcus pyridinivorans TaxID=103816 RepID=A0A7M2XW24_9NOCA|nr:serine hydrolase domain-containing protein [Rhodococcus pyridinivorans]QOW02037.1 beta-lactamase family protein [Rhodococcus pyridinivorans]